MKIFLVGMMGSGKTTIARILGDVLCIDKIDMDDEIEKAEGRKISEIFEKDGEAYFRSLESALLKKLIEKDGSFVVSTGGGIVLSDENRMLLKREKVIYLKVSLDELKRRVRLENRPLLGNDRTRMDDIYEMRKNLYEEFETLDTTYLGKWETVAKILYTLDLKDLAAFKEFKIDSTIQDVHIEVGGLKELPSDKYVFTCEKVAQLYGEFLPTRRLVLPNGESAKDISHVLDAYEYLLKNDVTRNDTLIGVGGGTATDFTGFVGSTYKRGMNFAFYPTTLLASIDAAIGGKNGIDFAKYKNVVGTINIPAYVVIDPLCLISLPQETFIEGLVEGYKMALISGGVFYRLFLNDLNALLKRNLYALKTFIKAAVEEKLKIVEKDLKEKSIRSYLNLGHTLGHAFESITELPHGLSVGWGLYKELEYFKVKGCLSKKDCEEIQGTLKRFLPERIIKMCVEKVDRIHREEMERYMANDKKVARSGKVHIPILRGLGDVVLEEVELKDLLAVV